MTFNSPLELIEKVSQLHKDHQTCHAQEDIAPQLKGQINILVVNIYLYVISLKYAKGK